MKFFSSLTVVLTLLGQTLVLLKAQEDDAVVDSAGNVWPYIIITQGTLSLSANVAEGTSLCEKEFGGCYHYAMANGLSEDLIAVKLMERGFRNFPTRPALSPKLDGVLGGPNSNLVGKLILVDGYLVDLIHNYDATDIAAMKQAHPDEEFHVACKYNFCISPLQTCRFCCNL